jgi:hypothetical protein
VFPACWDDKYAVSLIGVGQTNRHDEARSAAKLAIDAAPTDERRSNLTQDLKDILIAG